MRLPFATATAFLAATAVANQAGEPEDNAIFEPSYNQAARSFDLDYDFNGYDGANNQRGRGYGALFDILGYLAEGTTIPARRVQTNQRGGYEDDYDYEDTYNQRGGVNKRSPAAFVAPSDDWLRRNPSLARKYRNHEIMF
ncbi:hypothetical protein DL89DRAFT_124677 [Linderina pennispora]|uniref:Uncharacterized protein n=1 Tax=Linderina pennispora TaxID=61395 RepID=A0A1Y1WCW2_9FUNG|nr:uncharacterized protein DL89DRAFT_124677 [Linderina pennispora]ORX71387.1 hypothetical protein DL89DRAFT_124677 [Linderina pennispora]